MKDLVETRLESYREQARYKMEEDPEPYQDNCGWWYLNVTFNEGASGWNEHFPNYISPEGYLKTVWSSTRYALD